jgi:Rieske Fe-S protein
VSYRSGEKDLYCPCHASNFALDGERIGDDNKSPRSLDTLEIDTEKLAAGEIWVTFLNFRIGVEEKEAIS